MAADQQAQVIAMMGFSTLAGKLQETDRIRGYQNSYITIIKTQQCVEAAIKLILEDGNSLIVSRQQHILTSSGWKQAEELQIEEWLCTQEEDRYVELKEILSSEACWMISPYAKTIGSYIAEGIILASNE